MTAPVLAIGLDAAEPGLLEGWMDRGLLPRLARLRREGLYARLHNSIIYTAESPWTAFITGCAPARTGHWTMLSYDPVSYRVEQVGEYDYSEFKPFYALGAGRRVAVFDVPQAVIVPGVDGIQVVSWGAHGVDAAPASAPAGLLDELKGRHGEHPVFDRDHLEPWQVDKLRALRSALATGIRRRASICRDLLARERWDLLLTVFGESHSVGHNYWHQSEIAHPLAAAFPREGEDPVLGTMIDIDRAVGEIIDAAPADARVVLFSIHGTEPNCMDVPSMFFLPELLYRMSFADRAPAGAAPLPPIPAPPDYWTNVIAREFWRATGRPRYWHERLWFMPATWYAAHWPSMRAFALPSYAEGYVRINLAGREGAGMVAAADYARVGDEVEAALRELRNPRTGRPILRSVLRTRRSPDERDPRLPDADLVVEWESEPTDVVDHPRHGRIGPVPYRRSGSHTSNGFALIAGPDIPAGAQPDGHALDLPATIIDLMGATPPQPLDGRSLLAAAATDRARTDASPASASRVRHGDGMPH